ncbi:sensor domain-containing protein [Streptosporangium canum]|uniref:sensor domain-containing protein n=1 Tax=Streptosporangium canum TaxID=324952 RepID=UPI003F4CEC6E
MSFRVLLAAPARKRAWYELGYALVSLPIAAVGLIYLLVMLLTAATAATFVGVPMLAAGVLGARALGAVDRGLARALLGVEVPVPPPFRPRPGLIGWLGSALGDGAGWRAAAYRLGKPPVAVLASGTAASLWGSGLVLLSCPIWWRIPALAHLPVNTWPRALLAGMAGAVLLLLAPWTVRAALLPDRLLVRALLARDRDLQGGRLIVFQIWAGSGWFDRLCRFGDVLQDRLGCLPERVGRQVAVSEHVDQHPDRHVGLTGMAEVLIGPDLVVVAAPNPEALQVAGLHQIGHDALGRPLGDADLGRHVTHAYLGIRRDRQQHAGVVGQERPGGAPIGIVVHRLASIPKVILTHEICKTKTLSGNLLRY